MARLILLAFHGKMCHQRWKMELIINQYKIVLLVFFPLKFMIGADVILNVKTQMKKVLLSKNLTFGKIIRKLDQQVI